MARYYNTKQIIRSLNTNRDCGIKEKAFDWREIAVRGFMGRRKILNLCRRYGKVERNSHGFSIRFMDI